MRCEAPVDEFGKFENIFSYIASEFYILDGAGYDIPYSEVNSKQSKYRDKSIITDGAIDSDDNNYFEKSNLNTNSNKSKIKYSMSKIIRIPLNFKGLLSVSIILLALGLLGYIMTLIALFKKWTFLNISSSTMFILYLFAIVGLVILRALFVLKKQGFKGFSTALGKVLLLLEKTGEIFLIKVHSDCPICDGKINVRKVRNRERYIGKCSINPEHIFSFDYTTFTGKSIIIEEIEIKIS